jgi:hypothetical protein
VARSITLTGKKGFIAKIFGKQQSCRCGPKIVPKSEKQERPEEKKESHKKADGALSFPSNHI